MQSSSRSVVARHLCLIVLGLGCGASPTGGPGTGTGGASAGGGTTGMAGSSGGGTTGTAGTTGNGGSSVAGTTGTAGSSVAGTTGMGGSSVSGTTGTAGARGGTTGTAGTGGSGGSGGSAQCTITATSSLSTKIPTVGIVTWSTSLTGVQSAKIDFGLTTSYGMTAPVDLTQASYRTLLLGMKGSHLYHYRVTATNSSGSCQSQDYTVMTGPVANGLIKPTVTNNNAAALAGGFLITGQYVANANGSAPAYILDNDGDIVWWYNIENQVTGVVMDYAGTHMWINNHPANDPNLLTAKMHRVTMDGMTDEDLTSQFSQLSHQVTVLPDETVAFYAADGGADGCSDIKERAPNGTVRKLVNSQVALGTTGPCHVNEIQYSKEDDTLVFSDHIHCAVAKIKRSDGSTVWILNGGTRTFTGDTWQGSEHGIHILGLDDFLIFNNNTRTIAGSNQPGGTGDGSMAIEIKLNLTAKTVTKIWSYKAMGTTYQNDIMGDLQRLPNNNIVIAFGGKGIIQEITAAGTVLQEMKTMGNFGYIQKRMTLYGPPPR